MHSDIRELTAGELNAVGGGEITVVADKDYVGIEVRVGGYGFAVWVTGGQVCGATYTPHHNGGRRHTRRPGPFCRHGAFPVAQALSARARCKNPLASA